MINYIKGIYSSLRELKSLLYPNLWNFLCSIFCLLCIIFFNIEHSITNLISYSYWLFLLAVPPKNK